MDILKNKDNKKNKTSQTLFFNHKITEKSKVFKNDKSNGIHNLKKNYKMSNKNRNKEDNLLTKSKSRISKPLNDISFNNSYALNQKIDEKQLKDDNNLNKSFNIINGNINSSKSKISNMKTYHNEFNQKQGIFNDNLNNKDKKIENISNIINIINYKKTAPNIKKINNNKGIKDFSGEPYINFSNGNISSSINTNSIDHLFYKPIKHKTSLNKKNKQFFRISSNLSPINSIKINNLKNGNSNINKSFSLRKNNNLKSDNLPKSNLSYIQKNNSALNIGKQNINKMLNFQYNEFEKKNKMKLNKNIFEPKNIFSKYKKKKNKFNINELLLNQKLLIRNNLENENQQNLNVMNTSEIEKDVNYNNNLISLQKGIKLDEYNNNNQNNNILIKNVQNNQNTQMNSNNIISYTTLITGTDNLNNNNSQNINDINNINNNINHSKEIFKGKKIRCIHDISKTGLSGEEKKVNQDRYFIFHNFVTGFENIFMGVLDGHGYFGHEVSEYIRENLPMDLNRVLKTKKINLLKDDISQIIKQTFEMENNSLLRNKQIDSNLSGSTCVSVIYTPEKLIIANLGDSRCVLGKKINNEWKAENLTRDHKPNIPEEAERIKSYGGRIRPMKDEDGNFVGPLRVYMKEKDIPGLAMTRSFGDYYASTAGTICIPEVTEYKFMPEDKFLVLASDGLFEFIDSEEVVSIVSGYYAKNDIVGCSEFLYKESYRKWISEEEDTVDDITIIIVFFEE